MKTGWKPLVGLALAVAGWLRLSKSPGEAEFIEEGTASDPCPEGKIRVWGFAEQAFVCIPIKK